MLCKSPLSLSLFAALQQSEFQVHAQDPLHLFKTLELGAEPAVVRIQTNFEGTLHVWTESTTLNPRSSG